MLKYISKQDEGTLLMLFVRDGYVLDFTDNTFDIFTTNSVGEALKSKYKMSKGKSLVAYLNSTYKLDMVALPQACDRMNYEAKYSIRYLTIALSKA